MKLGHNFFRSSDTNWQDTPSFSTQNLRLNDVSCHPARILWGFGRIWRFGYRTIPFPCPSAGFNSTCLRVVPFPFSLLYGKFRFCLPRVAPFPWLLARSASACFRVVPFPCLATNFASACLRVFPFFILAFWQIVCFRLPLGNFPLTKQLVLLSASLSFFILPWGSRSEPSGYSHPVHFFSIISIVYFYT